MHYEVCCSGPPVGSSTRASRGWSGRRPCGLLAAIALAAVVGSLDAERGEVMNAYVVATPGVAPDDELARELQAFVRERLSAHEYPRAVAFVEELR